MSGEIWKKLAGPEQHYTVTFHHGATVECLFVQGQHCLLFFLII